jgi:hypothetical protein
MNPTIFRVRYGPRTAQDEQQVRGFLRMQAEIFPTMPPEEAIWHCAELILPTRKWDVPTLIRWAKEARNV